jgi:integrase
MAIVAMCTGLRVSEVLALLWEHIDFDAGVMLVQQGAVNGRIGKVKTEASQDEVPLDPAFAAVLLRWKGDRSTGLVFPSHVTGGCYHAGMIQRQILRPKGEQIRIPRLGWHTFCYAYRGLAGRDRCSDWGSAEVDATQQRVNDHERLWLFVAASQAKSQLESSRDGHDKKAADWARVSGLIRIVGFCGVERFD